MKELMNMYLKMVLNAQEMNLATMKALLLNSANTNKGTKISEMSEEIFQEFISWFYTFISTFMQGFQDFSRVKNQEDILKLQEKITKIFMQAVQDFSKVKSHEDMVKLQEKITNDLIKESLSHGENLSKIVNDWLQQVQACAKNNTEDLTCRVTDHVNKFTENFNNNLNKMTETVANTFTTAGGCCGSTTGGSSSTQHGKKQNQRSTEDRG